MGCPPRARTPSSGTASCPASGCASIRRAVRSTSFRAGGRAAFGASPSAGMASLPPTGRAKRAVAAIGRIKNGESPAPPAARAGPALTVADLAKRYMEAHVAVNCNAHTHGIYRGSLDNHILPALGTMAVDAVGQAEVADAALRAPRHPARGQPGADGAVQDVLAHRGLGAGPGRTQPLPFRAQVQGGQARAVSQLRGVPAGWPGAAQAGGRGSVGGARRGGAQAADTDRVPAPGDPDPQVGRRRPEGRGAAPARREDGRAHGAAHPRRGGGPRGGRPGPGQPLGVPRARAGPAPVAAHHVLAPRADTGRGR